MDHDRLDGRPSRFRRLHGGLTMRCVDPDRFRTALAALPAGVTVVTSRSQDGEAVGATVSAFTSLSADPALVLVSLTAGSRIASAAQSCGAFAAHIVGDRHSDLAMGFARGGGDLFGVLPHRTNTRGVPVLEGFEVSLECSLHAQHPGGDHVILIGLVEEANILGRGPPAVWYDRRFHQLQSHAA